MPPLRDLTGQKFGHLTVIKRALNKGKQVAWECKCDCGKIVEVRGNNLTRENYRTTSCGCKNGLYLPGMVFGDLIVIEEIENSSPRLYKCKCSCGDEVIFERTQLTSNIVHYCGNKNNHIERTNFNDLTGQVFGKLTVLNPLPKRVDNKVVWLCQCECGNTVEVISTNLIKGNTLSCGCYHKEQITNDITNKRFGKLVALYPTEKRYGSSIIWKCQCDCGTICEKPSNSLVSGGVKSCGCLISYGEEKIRTMLNEYQILFETQKAYDTCRFSNGRLAHFDFLIEDSYLIEYDGEQHYFGWSYDIEDLKIQQQRDAYKNQWCKDNNIPLIRIPYTKLDTLCIEDLLLETTQFRVI